MTKIADRHRGKLDPATGVTRHRHRLGPRHHRQSPGGVTAPITSQSGAVPIRAAEQPVLGGRPPADWPDGSVRCVRARGGLAVDLSWRGGQLVAASIRKLAGRIRCQFAWWTGSTRSSSLLGSVKGST